MKEYSENETLIKVENLVRVFWDYKRGEVRAVDDITFEVKAGRIFGLLGPNGAGKTTTLRILGTVLPPTSGNAYVLGHNVQENPIEVRRNIGYISSSTGVYQRMTPREMLKYFGTLYGMSKAEIQSRTREIFDMLDMNDFADTLNSKLSSGMKQKTNIARTIIHNPSVMIFDEPTLNLDILVAKTVQDFVLEMKKQNRAVIFSTHYLAEVERLCDDIGIIHNGKLLTVGEKDEIVENNKAKDVEELFFKLVKKE